MNGLRQIFSKVAGAYVEIAAEQAFQAAAVGICESVKPWHLQQLVDQGKTLGDVLESLGYDRDELAIPPGPGVEYLMECSDEVLMELLDQVLPDHVKVIRGSPGFSSSVIGDLRSLIGGRNGSYGN